MSLASQVITKRSTLSLIRIHMLIDDLMADRLLRAICSRLHCTHFKKLNSSLAQGATSVSDVNVLRSYGREISNLLVALTSSASVTTQLTTVGGPLPSQQFAYLSAFMRICI